MFRRSLFIIILFTLLISACGAPAVATNASATESAIVVTEAPVTEMSTEISAVDGLGRTVTLTVPAAKVISLSPSNTEILYAVGAGDQVVGRDELSDFPEEAKAVESVGGSMGDFSTEAIVALQPDLVLASELNAPELVKSIEDLGVTVYSLPNPKSFEDLYKNIETVATLTGHDATDLIDSLKARVAAVDEKIAPLSSRIPVFYELDGTDPLKPWTSGPGTFVDLLINRAGGFNVGSSLQGEWAQISSEELVAADPHVILLGDALYGVTVESVAARTGWDSITAVKNSAIYPFNPDTATRPGPRLVDALEEMAKLLRPELFQ
ncbi:MAG: ABC transporter substrate-binding protein [Anaerolineales bacterium]|nr:ABC transporter substrate-binding protein [Anaerolineales bacterium]